MRISKSQKIKTGIFTIIGFVLLLAGILIIGGNKHLLGNTFTIYGTFRNIGGLQTGNNVRFAGINIGTVERISIINDTTVRVDMRLESKVAPFIKSDAVAGISSDGIMGDKLVTIAPGSADGKVLGEGKRVHTTEPLEMDRIMDRLANVAVNAETITDDLAGITSQIREGKGSMGRLLYDEQLAKGLEGTVNTANETMKSIKAGSEGFGENMKALRENVLLRGYFKRQEKERRKKSEQSQESAPAKKKE
jgi:phospholipid/cholesterol/gamma-HCH transport system substrate-binding protein